MSVNIMTKRVITLTSIKRFVRAVKEFSVPEQELRLYISFDEFKFARVEAGDGEWNRVWPPGMLRQEETEKRAEKNRV